MRVFWWQGGLHVQPESREEGALLTRLVESVQWGMPPAWTRHSHPDPDSDVLEPGDRVAGGPGVTGLDDRQAVVRPDLPA